MYSLMYESRFKSPCSFMWEFVNVPMYSSIHNARIHVWIQVEGRILQVGRFLKNFNLQSAAFCQTVTPSSWCRSWGPGVRGPWGFLRDRATTTKAEGCVFTRGAARLVVAGGLPLQADCLCSFWRPATFNRHQFRQEKHNRHAQVFSHCKYFLSCQLPSLPARARSLSPIFPPLPPLQSCRPGRCVSLSRWRCSPSAHSPAAPVRLCWQKATCARKNTRVWTPQINSRGRFTVSRWVMGRPGCVCLRV